MMRADTRAWTEGCKDSMALGTRYGLVFHDVDAVTKRRGVAAGTARRKQIDTRRVETTTVWCWRWW